MLSVLRDLRYQARLLWNAPAFSLVALVTLALGMGASTAIFSVVDAVLLKPLPFRDPGRLLAIYEKSAVQQKFKLFVAGANFAQWQRQSQTLEGMAALQGGFLNLVGGPNGRIDPEELRVERVTASIFQVLGVQAAVGRTFLPEEDQPGRTSFALLSYRLWQRRFAGDPAITGKPIVLSSGSFTVVGIMPPGFSILDPTTEVWIPMGLNPSDARARGRLLALVVGRMKPGITIEQARQEMEAIGNGLERLDAALNTGWRPSLFPLREERVGSVRRALQVLMAAVSCLLLMACANVANLLLIRGAIRRKELAIRAALGASQSRIVGQLLAESIRLALAAGMFGLVIARGGMALLERVVPANFPQVAQARLDLRLFLFALAVSVATGTLFGMAPAFQVSGARLYPALTEGGRGGTTGRRGRMARSILVVAEVALAVVVLIGAGLLIRSFVRLRAADVGFQASGLLTGRLSLAGTRNMETSRRIAFVQQVTERLAALPGVRAAGAISSLPLTGLWDGAAFWVEGRPVPAQRPIALTRAVTPAYFSAMGIPVTAGRAFTPADSAQAPMVVMVSQALARRFWPQENPIGRRLILATGRALEIVGVVGDVKQDRIDGDDALMIYAPYAQAPYITMSLAVRTAGPPRALSATLLREVHELDPDQPVTDVRAMEDVVDRAVAGPRFNTVVLGGFAVIAFLLASVGIYGVIACDVAERIHEIGIRVALGAQASDVLKLVVGQGARLAAYGIAAGLVAAFLLTRLMAGMLYGVKATDEFTFALIAAVLGAVALAASYLPSRRAMALDPVVALRHE